MAKGKHSTALFEVISAGKRPAGRSSRPAPRPSAASLLRTPKWWFKNRGAGPADAGGGTPTANPRTGRNGADVPAAAADPDDPTANVTAATLIGRRAAAGPGGTPADLSADPGDGPFLDPHVEESLPAAPAPPPTPPPPRDFSDPEPVLLEQAAEMPVVLAPAVTPPPAPKPAPKPAVVARRPAPRDPGAWRAAGLAGAASRTGVHWAVDRGRREVTLRMRYTAAAVSGVVVLTAVGLAYVIGKHVGDTPLPHVSAVTNGAGTAPQAPSARDLKKGPVQQGALDPLRAGARQASARLDGAGGAGGTGGAGGAGGAAGAYGADDSGLYLDAPIGPDGSARRDVNRNYVVVQSYPLDMRETAVKACDFLTRNGIPCTIEARSNWLRVVGTRGFQRRFLDSKEYQAYKKQIVSLGEKFAGKSNFKQFEPAPYKWDGR